jgi:hypothetical protein
LTLCGSGILAFGMKLLWTLQYQDDSNMRRLGLPQGQKSIETLCLTPRKPVLLGHLLHISSCHINANCITSNGSHGLFLVVALDVPEILPHDDSKLDFIMELYTARPKDWTSVWRKNRRRGFQKVYRTTRCSISMFFGMVSGIR